MLPHNPVRLDQNAPSIAASMAPSAKSLQDRVRRKLATFTDAERWVAHAWMGEYPMAGLETVARFARRAQTSGPTSGPTILRFVSRLGFGNCTDFQHTLRSEIHARLQSPLSRYEMRQAPGDQSATCERLAHAMRQNIERAERD